MKLKVQVKDSKNCEKILKIEVGEDRIREEYDAIYTELIPKAKIPGFRPGKAPKNVVALHYKNEAREQVLKNLLNDTYRDALKENEIQPLGYPEIKDVKFDDRVLSFEASIEVRPKIKLSKVKGLSAKKENVAIKADEVDEELKKTQESLAQFKAVEDRTSQMGDFVIADYTCSADGKEVEKRSDDWFELKDDEFLKGFSNQLTGLKPGSEKEVRITFPESLGRKELAGKEAVFQVKVKEIKTKQLPELNDDMAREAGDFGSLAEFREKIQKDIKTRREQEADQAYENALLDDLLKKNKIDLPPKLVERRIDYMLEQAKTNILRHGGGDEEVFEKEKEKLREGFKPEAEKQVHLAFLLDEIAETEDITVTDDDLKKKYQTLAEKFRQPVENIEKYYTEGSEAVDALKDQIRNEKTVEFLKQNAKN